MRQRNEKFEEIVNLVENFEGEDAILQTMKLRKVLEAFNRIVTNEKSMSELFDVLNTRALEKGETFIQNFVNIVTSRQFDAININGKIIRHGMLEVLQKNFQCADKFKRDDIGKFYNSIRLLGEFYNKARISNGNPINILSTSLLNLLNVEIEKELKNIFHFKNDEFSDLLLGQIVLNGSLLKTRHKTEIEVFLLHVRRCLIELYDLSANTRAFLLMILDLYYSNFNYNLLENCIEKLYSKYLPNSVEGSKEPKKEELNKSSTSKSNENGNNNKSLQPPFVATTSMTQKIIVKSERRSESYHRNVPTRSPTKTSTPTRKSEPHSYQPKQYRHPPTSQQLQPRSPQKTSPPQKKLSPRDLKNKVKLERGSSAPPPISPRRLEKELDKLNIEAASHISKQKVSEQIQVPSNIEENILRQQNSSENSSPSGTLKPKPVTNVNKVYFKEENSENLSWNGETSFEDDPEATLESPRASQYSSSFLNFLSNN